MPWLHPELCCFTNNHWDTSPCEYSSDWSSQPMVNNIPAETYSSVQLFCSLAHHFVRYRTWEIIYGAVMFAHPSCHYMKMYFFSLVLGCLQNPGDIWAVLPQASGQASYPQHKLAVEDWAGWHYWKCHYWWLLVGTWELMHLVINNSLTKYIDCCQALLTIVQITQL